MSQINGTANKERILIVDDDDVTRRLASHIFEKAGYEVVTAEDGASGMRLVDSFRPDLLILDVMMPDISGLEVCERLRSDPTTSWLPIIMLSAKSTVDDKLDGFQAGADDYVAKPVSHKELLARANALLARARRNQPSKARVIAAVGVKGGVGVTTVMINIGVQLATQDKSALLLELRSTRGTVGHNLALSPAEDLGGLLIRSPADIRPADVTRRVVRHRSGIKVLTGPSSAADYAISEAHVHIILEALMSQADYVLLDLPSVSAGGIQLALEQADQIMLVLEPETISVNCARADLEILKAWGVFDRTSLMIVSRARSSNLIAPKDIEKELGIDVIGALPPSPEVFYLAANLANPVVLSKPDSLAATTLVKLTRTLEEQLPVASPVRVR